MAPERPPVPQAYRTAARHAHRDAARPRHRPATYRVTPRMPDPADAFETWLLRRVAEDIEGNEVSADLLTELRAALAEVRARPPEARGSLALMELAERVNLPVGHLRELLAVLERQPTVTRERIRRRLVEAWLNQQRQAYYTDRPGGDDGEVVGR